MKIKLRATPDFRFEAINPDNGYSFHIGASKAIGGDDSGFRPMQLVLAAIGSCAGIDAVNILKKSRVDFDSIEVEVEADRVEGTPAPFKSVLATFTVIGRNVDFAKAEKAVTLSMEKYCSVSASLDPKIKVNSVTKVLEAKP